ncbi:helix-turn-helix domain-containing protein [Nonomuraea sp. NPDC050328]|uniref:helix-turn-helix domain-containing protein n=1 Tax=Nonomuraea sp. NPDC050328 TaxID=3364361 RepID=UPI0037AC4240
MTTTRPTLPPAAAREQDTYLKVHEVAAAMRVCRMTVYRLIHSGSLPAIRVGRSFRVSELAVDDYLKDARYNA